MSTQRVGHQADDKCPILLVSGFLVSGVVGEACWGEATRLGQRTILSRCGPGSSAHDRACELFYQLVGGRVDYGEEHAAKHGHERYGKDYGAGEYLTWCEADPIHVVGHSFGGTTARVLQQLLADRHFPGYNTSAAWIRSVTTISTPHNGSNLVYALGADPVIPGFVWPLFPGWIISKIVYLWDYLPVPEYARSLVFDAQIDHWPAKKWMDSTSYLGKLGGFLQSAIRGPPYMDCVDNAPFDMTPVGTAIINNTTQAAHPSTYYFSYVATMTERPFWSETHWPKITNITSMALSPSAFLLGRPASITPTELESCVGDSSLQIPRFSGDIELANDGLCSAGSQAHPYACDDVRLGKCGGCVHAGPAGFGPGCEFKSGKWYVTSIQDTSHLCIVGVPKSSEAQREFFKRLFDRLDSLNPCTPRAGA